MDWIEKQDNVTFVTGLSSNAVLKELAQPLLERALSQYKSTQQKVCFFHSVHYKAGSWNDKYRRVVIKAEVSEKEQNVRFVVTSMEGRKQSNYISRHVLSATNVYIVTEALPNSTSKTTSYT